MGRKGDNIISGHIYVPKDVCFKTMNIPEL